MDKHIQDGGLLMKILQFVFFIVIIVSLSACGGESNMDEQQMMTFVDVKISTEPKNIMPGEEVTVQAHVTQGEENVNDADYVTFEIWKKGEEPEEPEEYDIENIDDYYSNIGIEGELQGEGIYSIKTTFEEEGIYYVTAHVTARGMHNMPKKELIVGNVSTKENQTQDK